MDLAGIDVPSLKEQGINTLGWAVEYPDSTGGEWGVIGLDSLSSELHIECDKVLARISVYGIASGTYVPYVGIEIPVGQGCPLIYAWSEQDVMSKTDRRDTVRLCKLAARMSLSMKDLGAEGMPLRLYSVVNGYDADFSPSPGTFLVDLKPDQEGSCDVFIPRQVDRSLKVLQYKDALLIREFSLGSYLYDLGYDWGERDLIDFSVELNYAGAEILFKNSQWKRIQNFSIVL